MFRSDIGQDGVTRVVKKNSNGSIIPYPEAEPCIPIYDLQMFEGPQINARHIQRELQMAYEENPAASELKPKIITGSVAKQNHQKKIDAAKAKMSGVGLEPKTPKDPVDIKINKI